MASRSSARPTGYRIGDLPVRERILGNGLKALVMPRRESPIVVYDIYYPAGSASDFPGKTGLAHFVEHMLFKGTDRFPRGAIDAHAYLAGGQTNAETGEDLTHYWFALPASRRNVALAIEADRMARALFRPEDVESERRVIAEERARDLDTPQGRLEQMHLELSYLVHPYRNPILGRAEDVDAVTALDLDGFHRRYYRPAGAVLVVAGPVDAERALDEVEEAFGAIADTAPRLFDPLPLEPPQTGRREFRLNEAEGMNRGLFGWRAAPARHADQPALDVMAGVLAVGWRARLWEELVEKRKLANWVEACAETSRHAGRFVVQVDFPTEVEPERVEDAVLGVISELRRRGPTPIELARCRARLESAWRWEREDPVGLAAGLGPVALWDDWRTWQDEQKAALAVSAADVERVASKHTVDENLTVGWLLPPRDRAVSVFTPGDIHEPTRERGVSRGAARFTFGPVPALLAERSKDREALADACEVPFIFEPSRSRLENGLRIISERRRGSGVAAIELGLESGMLHEASPGVAHLTGRMLEEGTQALSARRLAEAIEDIGGSLDISSSRISLKVRAEDLEPAVSLLADLVRRPAFPKDEVDWAKRKTISEVKADREDPAYLADQLFSETVYRGHPYARDPRGAPAQIARLTLSDIREHHARTYRPEGAIFAAAGDFSTRTLRALVRKHFGDWTCDQPPVVPPADPVRAERARSRRLYRPGRQVQIVLGHLGIRRDDPKHDALLVLDHILGSGPGFCDRLTRILREELGLVYHVSGSITDTADTTTGAFRVALATRPGDAKRAAAAAVEQIKAMCSGDFSDREVEVAKRYLAGAWVFDYQTAAQRAERLFEIERWGLPLDDPHSWPARLAKITPALVRKAAAEKLSPTSLVKVELGPIARAGKRAQVAG